ncbi:MAG: alpha/beta hydrolase [Aeromicrobium sp.]
MVRGRARAHGAELAFQVEGPRDGPALLLLPGQANSHHWWDDLRRDFSGQFRTITFDYRGTGSTRAHEEPWSTSSFAADAAAVLAAVGVERAHVYGTSMGGRVAQMLAIEHPEVVDRLVLACTSPGGEHALERSQAVRRTLAHPDSAQRRSALLHLMYTDDWFARPQPPSTLLGDPDMTPGATILHLRVSDRHDAWDRLPAIAAPTLVLHGADDQLGPTANAPLIGSRIPDSRVEILPGRHGFFDELRAQVSPMVREHLLAPLP